MNQITLDTINRIATSMKQGCIFVNEDKNISLYSDLAKEILGITLPNVKSHNPGKIEDGDIVILIDRDLGNDDDLTPEDFTVFGIDPKEINMGDTILSIGAYKNKNIEAIYKVFGGTLPNRVISLNQRYLGFNIESILDLENRKMIIRVNGEEFYMHYIDNIGFLVVIDRNSGNVKFYQAKGYSYRKEDAGLLLRGKRFMGKNIPGEVTEFLPTIGMSSKDILDGPKFLKDLNLAFNSPNGFVKEGIYDIYRRMVYCHLFRVENSELKGVLCFVQDKDLANKTLTLGDEFINRVENAGTKKQVESFDENDISKLKDYIGNSLEIKNVKELAYKASKTKFNVIITGESGTGKSKLARAIHDANGENTPFVEVQCNAIAPSLFESELFGYVPGSFTGATKEGKMGFFEAANGGTIFLDEIGDVPYDIQIKLLQVIQDKRIYRVGSTKPIDIDVRIITATNKDLERAVKEGKFRQDLYYRINVFPIDIPPLRNHKRDLYVLANSILASICGRYNMECKQFSGEAIDVITNYDWPGNIRELENIIERAVTLCDGGIIYSDHLMINSVSSKAQLLSDRLGVEEKRIIEECLFKNNNDYKKTMEELGLSKSVFYERLKRYNLS